MYVCIHLSLLLNSIITISIVYYLIVLLLSLPLPIRNTNKAQETCYLAPVLNYSVLEAVQRSTPSQVASPWRSPAGQRKRGNGLDSLRGSSVNTGAVQRM